MGRDDRAPYLQEWRVNRPPDGLDHAGGMIDPPLGWGGAYRPCARPIGPTPLRLGSKLPSLRCPSPEGEGLIATNAPKMLGLMARVAGWRPDDFWAATPADVRAVLAGWVEDSGEASFDRAALSAMMEQFPDG